MSDLTDGAIEHLNSLRAHDDFTPGQIDAAIERLRTRPAQLNTLQDWSIDMSEDPFVAQPFTTDVDWYDHDSMALQVDGNDLVQISDIAPDGTATVTVFASTVEDSPVLFTGTVNVFAHRSE